MTAIDVNEPLPPPSSSNSPVDFLILGAGWTSSFLIPQLEQNKVSFAATTRDGRPLSDLESNSSINHSSTVSTIKFVFDPLSEDVEPYKVLPNAKTVLITFPIYVSGGSERLVRLWTETHEGTNAGFIQLGSTGIWNGDPTLKSGATSAPKAAWLDRHSAFDMSNERARAETELLALSPDSPTTVLDLCGLWGGKRSTRNWVGRVAPTKDALKNKTSVHMMHGLDVARAVLAVHQNFSKSVGERWLLTDERVYDWWDLASAWGSGGKETKFVQVHSDETHCTGDENIKAQRLPSGPQPGWVRELMREEGVRALPRSPEMLGRCLESREFWETFGLSPVRARLEE